MANKNANATSISNRRPSARLQEVKVVPSRVTPGSLSQPLPKRNRKRRAQKSKACLVPHTILLVPFFEVLLFLANSLRQPRRAWDTSSLGLLGTTFPVEKVQVGINAGFHPIMDLFSYFLLGTLFGCEWVALCMSGCACRVLTCATLVGVRKQVLK